MRIATLTLALFLVAPAAAQEFEGITVEPEENSDTYDRDDWNHWIDVPELGNIRDQVLSD